MGNIGRKLLAESLGTCLLLAIVVGSGIMGVNLADGNIAIALLANALATGAGLVVLILIFGPVSGAHFNPAVTLTFLARGEILSPVAISFIVAQCLGGILGVMLAHAMFDMTLIDMSTRVRTGSGQWIAEMVATFGLVLTILACVRFHPQHVPYAVGLYITAGYWFTASTSFANPAVTIARSLTNSFAGIRLDDVIPFIIAQLIGAGLAFLIDRFCLRPHAIS